MNSDSATFQTKTVPVELDLRKLVDATDQIEQILSNMVRREDGSVATADLISSIQGVCGMMTARNGIIFPPNHIDSFNVAISINEYVHAILNQELAKRCH